LGVQWTKSYKEAKSPNVTTITLHFNLISTWVQTEILKRTNLKDRYKVLKKFIKIAKFCYEFNNFNGVQEVLSGFFSSSVGRLKQTWKKLEAETEKTWNVCVELRSLMDSHENYKNMRQRLQSTKPPCIPYLGCYLSELSMVEEGNSNTLLKCTRSDMINFEKKRRVAFVIKEMLQFQSSTYNFKFETKIQTFLSKINALDEDVLYQLSLKCEPQTVRSSRVLTLKDPMRRSSSLTGIKIAPPADTK